MSSSETPGQKPSGEKESKSSPVIDAVFIGFLGGIVIYSVLANTWGFFTLIPLALIYMILKKSKKK
ncbi:MAG: hypothetical protein JNJ75_15500 [Cyclobacteriaceae bacterium]|nr:hypothetical protein [Cyclobacteriaceae bacterium]